MIFFVVLLKVQINWVLSTTTVSFDSSQNHKKARSKNGSGRGNVKPNESGRGGNTKAQIKYRENQIKKIKLRPTNFNESGRGEMSNQKMDLGGGM